MLTEIMKIVSPSSSMPVCDECDSTDASSTSTSDANRFIAVVGIESMCVISSPNSALPLRAIIDPAWIEVIQCGGHAY